MNHGNLEPIVGMGTLLGGEIADGSDGSEPQDGVAPRAFLPARERTLDGRPAGSLVAHLGRVRK